MTVFHGRRKVMVDFKFDALYSSVGRYSYFKQRLLPISKIAIIAIIVIFIFFKFYKKIFI